MASARKVSYGILLLSPTNPEQILYRSMQPVMTEEVPGWQLPAATSTAFIREHFTHGFPSR